MPHELPDLFCVLADCGDCRVQGAVVEMVDPAHGEGRAVEAACRLCGWRRDAGGTAAPGQRFTSLAEVRAALLVWAQDEGEADLDGFVAASFTLGTPDAVCAAVLAGQPVETGFDVIAYLFPSMQAGLRPPTPRAPVVAPAPVAAPVWQTLAVPTTWLGLDDAPPPGTGRPSSREATWMGPDEPDPDGSDDLLERMATGPDAPAAAPPASAAAPPAPAAAPPEAAAPRPPPPAGLLPAIDLLRGEGDRRRIAARALAAVCAADGVVAPAERRFLDAWLLHQKLPPLRDDELRVWRPTELGWPQNPERIVEAMAELVWADQQRDSSEWRVVREFARHWGLSLQALETWAVRREARNRPAWKRAALRVRGVLLSSG